MSRHGSRAQQREYLETVKLSADGLLSVVNDILDFSKIEAGHLELDQAEFNLRETVETALKTVALRAHQKGLELFANISPEVPLSVRGDANRLRQVILNLVGNAIKFTSRGEVVVGIKTVETTQAKSRCNVRSRTRVSALRPDDVNRSSIRSCKRIRPRHASMGARV